MKEARTESYVNLYAVLGAIPYLCRMDTEAQRHILGKNVSIGFAVKGGPHASLHFTYGKCRMTNGTEGCDILLPFSSPEKFNGMINGSVTPIPARGLTRLRFLLRDFTALTNLLTRYLRPSDDDLQNPAFFRTSTLLTLHVIAEAVAQIGNHDPIGQASASYITDGTVRLSIGEEIAVGLHAENHHLTAIHHTPRNCTAYMAFRDLSMAADLFAGRVCAASCVGSGSIRIGGMISQIDNVNRILDRVSQYLA